MDKVKVVFLKQAGPYSAGQEAELDAETAAHVADGVKAVRADEYAKLVEAKRDPKNLTLKEMNDLGLKNVASPDLEVYQKAESAAQAGRPVASAEPLTVTGGVTPPTTVFPAFAKLQGHAVTAVEDVKPKKAEAKKPEAPKAPEAPASAKPEEKK